MEINGLHVVGAVRRNIAVAVQVVKEDETRAKFDLALDFGVVGVVENWAMQDGFPVCVQVHVDVSSTRERRVVVSHPK